jgi:hypothetical protein
MYGAGYVPDMAHAKDPTMKTAFHALFALALTLGLVSSVLANVQ